MLIEECDNIESLRQLGSEWLSELQADRYGLDADIEIIKADLESWNKGEGAVLVAKHDNEIVALFALFAVPSYLGKQKIALEKYWYARKGSHFAGPRLYMAAIDWARQHNCSHLITSASKMMPDRHDSIGDFLLKTGARHFETSYIYQIGDV